MCSGSGHVAVDSYRQAGVGGYGFPLCLFSLRPEKFFVRQLLAAVGMSPSAAFPSDFDNPNRRVTLGSLIDDDLKFGGGLWANGLLIWGGGHFVAQCTISSFAHQN